MQNPPTLRTERLELVADDAETARAAVNGREELAVALNAQIPPEWPPEIIADLLEAWADTLQEHPDQVGWWNWHWVRDEVETGTRILIGSGGFRGPPDADGTVEVGYAVLDAYQRRGYAFEAMRALVEWAFDHPEVATVVGETFPHLATAVRVMERLSLTSIGPGRQDGTVRYGITRADHEHRR